MSSNDYLDEEGNAYSGGPQRQPPNPTPAPAPAFHDALSGALQSITAYGRGFGDARLNAIVPNLFYQEEERRRNLEATCKRLGEQKDQATADAAGLRVEVAGLKGEIETLKADARTKAAEVDWETRTTKLALGLTALLFPIAIGLLPENVLPACGLLLVTGASCAIGLKPSFLKKFEKEGKK